MNGRNPMRITTSILLIIFLLAPVVIRTIHALTEGRLLGFSITKTCGSTNKADAQLLFEVKGIKEKGLENSFDQLPLIYVKARKISFAQAEAQNYFSYQRFCFGGNRPLFLSKRAILV
jgi:hypothetical protein